MEKFNSPLNCTIKEGIVHHNLTFEELVVIEKFQLKRWEPETLLFFNQHEHCYEMFERA